MSSFEFKPPTPDNKAPSERAVFQSRLNELLLSGAPLREMAEMLGAEQYVEGEVGGGIRFNVKAFADAQYGVEEKVATAKRPKEQKAVLPPERYQKVERVLLLPGRGEIITGSGKGFEEKEIFPRDRVFVELLSEMQEPYSVVTGVVTKEMMRGQSYKIFIIKNRGKLFFINNEEGNTTFVVHDVLANDWSEYAGQTKDELRAQAENNGEKIEVINYPGNLEDWKMLMHSALTVPRRELVEVGENDVAGDVGLVEGGILDVETESAPASILEEPETPQKEKHEKIPEGWISLSLMSKVLPISREKIKRIIRDENLHKKYPNDFGEYKNNNGLVATFYGDTIVSSIKKYIDNMPERAPDGWATASALSIELDIDFYTIGKIAENYRESHPEWFQAYLSPQRKETLHFSPELTDIIRQEIKSRPPIAPDGWYTNKALKALLDSTQQTVGKIAENYREAHPEWFQDFTFRGVRGNSVREHYHPDLVRLIAEELSSRPPVAPDGWMTQGGLARKLNVQPEMVMRIINSLPESVDSLIETFSEPKGKGGHGGRKSLKYFHPDLVAKITEEIDRLHKEKKLKQRG